MLIVKTKGKNRFIAADVNAEEMLEKFEELKKDSDFDTIEIIDRTGRLYKQEQAAVEKVKTAKAAKKES